jgi:hypothetical protein
MTSRATKWALFFPSEQAVEGCVGLYRMFDTVGKGVGTYTTFDDETEARIAQVRYGGRLERQVGQFWEVVVVMEDIEGEADETAVAPEV